MYLLPTLHLTFKKMYMYDFFLISGDAIWTNRSQCLYFRLSISIFRSPSFCSGISQCYSTTEIINSNEGKINTYIPATKKTFFLRVIFYLFVKLVYNNIIHNFMSNILLLGASDVSITYVKYIKFTYG